MAAAGEGLGKPISVTTDTKMNGVVCVRFAEELPTQLCTGVCEEKSQLEGSRHSERT
jgi:hypothetical protein